MTKKCALIVSDNEITLIVLDLSLNYLLPDYQIVAVRDNAAALTEVQQHTFDLILTDYHLPRSNGLNLAQVAQEFSPHVLTILLTTEKPKDLHLRACSVNLAGILPNFFTTKELYDLLQASGLIPNPIKPLKPVDKSSTKTVTIIKNEPHPQIYAMPG